MRILITGGNGFLGKHICNNLNSKGIKQIKDISKEGDGYFIFNKKDFDLTNKTECLNLIESFNPTNIIHAAAKVGGIGANQKYPADFFYENIMMGINLIDSCKNKKINNITIIGTVCSYPKITDIPFKEEDLWNGYPEETNAAYGISKKVLLTQAISYKKQYGLNFSYLMLVNLYGPYDNFSEESSHVIPALIKKFVEAKNQNKPFVEIWGTGQASREFLFVEDGAEAIVRSLNFDIDEPMNIGSGLEINISQLVSVIKTIINYKGDIIFNSEYPDGQPRRCLDISKSKKILGNYCNISLYDGLKKTINWYLSK